MKLNTSQIPAYKKSLPTGLRAVLIYGPDAGGVEETAATLEKGLLASGDYDRQIFQGDDVALDDNTFLTAALSPALFGGKPLLRVRGGGDKLTATFKTLLEKLNSEDAFILVQAGDLGKKSSLRTLFEKPTPDIIALPCYADDARSIHGVIEETAKQYERTVEPAAITLLQQFLGSDRLQMRRELEKLFLYIGERPELTAADVLACGSNIQALGLEDVAYNALEGNTASSLAAWHNLSSEGESAISVLRALQNLLHRLLSIHAETSNGTPLAAALKTLYPPLFFKLEPRFTALLRQWSPASIEYAIAKAMQTEEHCKTTGVDAENTLSHFLLRLASRRKQNTLQR